MPKFEAPRGTQDILPAQQPLWERVIREAEDLCAAYGYRRITTPIFEDTELFARTSGAGSDVVQKEMYTFTDRGDRSLTLRPEATASVARAYIEHGLHREPQPVKTYSIGPNYRYSAPQRGKFREFWQLNIEAIGSDDPAIDAEIIQLFDELLRRLGIQGAWLELNSIGDRNCRPAYLERLNAWLDEHEGELDEDTRAKRNTSPLRVFDNLPQKPEAVQRALARGAEDRRVALRRVPGALRRGERDTWTRTESSTARSDARARARLLHAHDVRVHGRGARGAAVACRRRAVRLPDRGDRRPADARGRHRERDRAARSLARGAGHRGRAAGRSTSSSQSRTRSAAGRPRGARRAEAATAAPRTPTTRGAR